MRDSERSAVGVVLSRIRMPLLYGAVAFVIVGALLNVWFWIPLIVLAVAFAIVFRVGTPGGRARSVRSPVEGRWTAVHTPEKSVPSHGMHAYAQTYAFDLVIPQDCVSDGRWWPVARPADDFSSFGEPVLAVDSGTVVRVRDWMRDHGSRDSKPGLALFVFEAVARELLGPTGLLGNHIVLELDDGTFAVYAHLRRGSGRVSPGDRVASGEKIAECGNSGNTTQPHLHFQLQDRASTLVAAGVPVEFDPEPATAA
jgi:hypothetical protein